MVDYEQDIKDCIATLQNNGVILYPTDTVWGLGCDATDPVAIQKIYAIKKRSSEKNMIVLLAEPRDILQYVADPHPDIIDTVSSFERPTTVVYQHGLGLADGVIADDGSIAIRVTKDPFCKALIKRLKKPIVSTSANVSGEPSPATYADISQEVINDVDYAVHYRRTDTELHVPSRLVKINNDGSLLIIRN